MPVQSLPEHPVHGEHPRKIPEFLFPGNPGHGIYINKFIVKVVLGLAEPLMQFMPVQVPLVSAQHVRVELDSSQAGICVHSPVVIQIRENLSLTVFGVCEPKFIHVLLSPMLRVACFTGHCGIFR